MRDHQQALVFFFRPDGAAPLTVFLQTFLCHFSTSFVIT
jgi:hypothetical protein